MQFPNTAHFHNLVGGFQFVLSATQADDWLSKTATTAFALVHHVGETLASIDAIDGDKVETVELDNRVLLQAANLDTVPDDAAIDTAALIYCAMEIADQYTRVRALAAQN